MAEHSWKLERYSNKQQINKILDLRKIVFKGEDIDKENPEFWKWEFEDNYAGKANVFLAVDGDDVVGHYAVCPSTIYVGGQKKNGSIVVDVMTHPDYRFQGMFTKIGRFSLDASGEDGIDFSYGFPIRKSVLPGHLKVGWKVAFELPVYVYPVSFSRTMQKFISNRTISNILGFIPQFIYDTVASIKKSLLKKYDIEESESFLDTPALHEFIEKTKNQHHIMQRRDYMFLKWRYNDNKFRKYKIFFAYDKNGTMLGYIVLRKSLIYDLNCVTIVDIQTLNLDKKVMDVLLLKARDYSKACGAALIGCMINKNEYKSRMLYNLYIKSPYIFKMILHENKKIDYFESLLKTENWFLTWADTDDL